MSVVQEDSSCTTLNMEAVSSSETLEDIYQATWRHISEKCNNFQPFTWAYWPQRRLVIYFAKVSIVTFC